MLTVAQARQRRGAPAPARGPQRGHRGGGALAAQHLRLAAAAAYHRRRGRTMTRQTCFVTKVEKVCMYQSVLICPFPWYRNLSLLT